MSTKLREVPVPYGIWGEEQIEEGSFDQMNNAARLPVAVAGALMPDAHVGYGLPIGGVLATRNVVIPYAVGVDIACRMRMTIFPVKPYVLGQKPEQFENALKRQTVFGAGGAMSQGNRAEHAVLDDPAWQEVGFVRGLKNTAYGQLGTSGSGNHFVEWGSFQLRDDDTQLGLEAGEYLALLSHSGSRGVGFQIANHYSKLAMDLLPDLDKRVQHLAWLSLDSGYGHEYWIAMQLAGKFAAANHEVIHKHVAKAVGLKPAAVVENHHNFAWKEYIPDPEGEGEIEVVVHRKGATPAGQGILGIIPGSMGDHGYVVRGRGNAEALNSASHGAGRRLSRRKATESITKTERDKYLRRAGVTLIGGGMDEAPQAYKNIDDVINAQADLVTVTGKFTPRIVRMDGKVEGLKDSKSKRNRKKTNRKKRR